MKDEQWQKTLLLIFSLAKKNNFLLLNKLFWRQIPKCTLSSFLFEMTLFKLSFLITLTTIFHPSFLLGHNSNPLGKPISTTCLATLNLVSPVNPIPIHLPTWLSPWRWRERMPWSLMIPRSLTGVPMARVITLNVCLKVTMVPKQLSCVVMR